MKPFALAQAAGAVLLCAALHSQQPPGYLTIALKSSSSAPNQPAILFLDPATGTTTPVIPSTGPTMTHATAVGQGPSPQGLLVVGSPSTVVLPWFWHLQLAGNRHGTPAAVPVTLPSGTVPHRLAYCAPAQGVVFTIQGGAANDLYFMDAVTRKVARANARIPASTALAGDVLVLGNKAYAAFYKTTGTRTGMILEWTLSAQPKLVTIYTSTNPVVGLDQNDLGLWIVDDKGDVALIVNTKPGWLLPPTRLYATGVPGTLGLSMDKVFGPFLAAANKQGGTDIFQGAATGAKKIFTDPRPFGDFSFAKSYEGGILFYGRGCAGTTGTPRMVVSGYPTVAKPPFVCAMQGGPANAPALLAIGFARKSISLAPMGATGCFLYNDAVVVLGSTTNTTGTASISGTFPPSASGLHFFGQWGLLDKAANAAGLITTEGAEYVVF